MTTEATSNDSRNAILVARALGWFSIGLGATELLAPKFIGRVIGIRGHEALIRAMGAREIAAGIAVLKQKRPVESMAGRVAGDAVDLALLGAGLASRRTDKAKAGCAIGIVGGITAVDVMCTLQLANRGTDTLRTTQTIAVNRSQAECYQFWRDLENLPRFMRHVESVQMTGEHRAHWVVKAPAGATVEWDAEVIEDSPYRLAWRSLPGADIDNAGSVEFHPGTTGHGTIVKASIEYNPPGGRLGSVVAKLFGEEPSIQAKMDLRRFKAVIETGEVPTIEGQSSARAFSNT